ncbi:MAG: hypothetical protein ACO3AE_01960 [Robiginitalea sp.]
MKNTFLSLGIAVALLTSCESDDTPDIVINDNSTTNIINGGGGDNPGDTVVTLSGVYTEDLTLDAETEYLITGPVLLASGATLTIPAGMTIKAQPVGVNAYGSFGCYQLWRVVS